MDDDPFIRRRMGKPALRIVLAALAVAAMLAAGQVHAGALAPAPQIIAEYDRSFI